ncbi:MAG: neutral zinc metallopeptidase [Propionibacteriaceae bacterium]|nr:neutral zinc metallopeptidase [Propionibacteriaceae bacterium]
MSPRGTGVLLAIGGVVMSFILIAGLTLVVLLRSPVGTSLRTGGDVTATTPATADPTAAAEPPSTEPGRRRPGHPTGSPTPALGSLAEAEGLAENVLTTVRLSDTSCPDFRLKREPVDEAELHAYLEAQVDCLMAVTQQPFEDAGVSIARPVIAPESERDQSICEIEADEPEDWAGLYCGANSTIYYRTEWRPENPLHYAEVIAHEFAHHLQYESGVLSQVGRAQLATRTEPNGGAKEQELSRRVELQAECLTGAAVGPHGPFAVQPDELAELLTTRTSVPPEWAATHGTGQAQTRWFKAGAGATGPERLATCNTFAAPAELVD